MPCPFCRLHNSAPSVTPLVPEEVINLRESNGIQGLRSALQGALDDIGVIGAATVEVVVHPALSIAIAVDSRSLTVAIDVLRRHLNETGVTITFITGARDGVITEIMHDLMTKDDLLLVMDGDLDILAVMGVVAAIEVVVIARLLPSDAILTQSHVAANDTGATKERALQRRIDGKILGMSTDAHVVLNDLLALVAMTIQRMMTLLVSPMRLEGRDTALLTMEMGARVVMHLTVTHVGDTMRDMRISAGHESSL